MAGLGMLLGLAGCGAFDGAFTTLTLDLKINPTEGDEISASGEWDVDLGDTSIPNRGLILQKSAHGSGSLQTNLLNARDPKGVEKLTARFDFSLADVFQYGPLGIEMFLYPEEGLLGSTPVGGVVDDIRYANNTFQTFMSFKGVIEEGALAGEGGVQGVPIKGGDYDGKLMVSLDCDDKYTDPRGCLGGEDTIEKGTLFGATGGGEAPADGACPIPVQETFIKGTSCSLSGQKLNLGVDDIPCKKGRGLANHCYAEKEGVEAAGCTWKVQLLGFSPGDVQLVAKANDGCETPHCAARYGCSP
jgi:hypothetical protein